MVWFDYRQKPLLCLISHKLQGWPMISVVFRSAIHPKGLSPSHTAICQLYVLQLQVSNYVQNHNYVWNQKKKVGCKLCFRARDCLSLAQYNTVVIKPKTTAFCFVNKTWSRKKHVKFHLLWRRNGLKYTEVFFPTPISDCNSCESVAEALFQQCLPPESPLEHTQAERDWDLKKYFSEAGLKPGDAASPHLWQASNHSDMLEWRTQYHHRYHA